MSRSRGEFNCNLRVASNTCQRSFCRLQFTDMDRQTVSPEEPRRPRALFLAGHPALDFLNTRMRVDVAVLDLLQSDEDVLIWLRQAGFPTPRSGRRAGSISLLRSARRLRESVRSLVEARKTGQRGDLFVLNSILAASRGYPQLIWRASNVLKIETIRRQETVGSILAPVAEAAAELLTTVDFGLIKHCEDNTCTLWFSDHTKSHNRRWCSMEICGNRNKVAAYRLRDRNRRPTTG
jgi:predicted RNA-binding Zn ribbon-like protein